MYIVCILYSSTDRSCVYVCEFYLYGMHSPLSQTPGRIQKIDPPYGSVMSTIGVLESRIGGFHFLDPPSGLGRDVS